VATPSPIYTNLPIFQRDLHTSDIIFQVVAAKEARQLNADTLESVGSSVVFLGVEDRGANVVGERVGVCYERVEPDSWRL